MQSMRRQSSRAQQGFSLLEILLTLTVVTVCAIAAVQLYRSNASTQALNQTNELIAAVRLCGQHEWASGGAINGQLIPQWVAQGELPKGMMHPRQNPWGAHFHAHINGQQLTLNIDGVPSDAGAALVATWSRPDDGIRAMVEGRLLTIVFNLMA